MMTINQIVMRKSFLMISALMLLLACGGKKAQGGNVFFCDDPQKQEMVAVRAFVEQFYKEWDKRDLLDYEFVKQYITPNLLKYLADAYDYDCEGECLATWMFFYEGGGDAGELKSYTFTPRDESHVLVECKYENYEYDVLLTVIKDGDTFKIDSLKQERSAYIGN